MSFTYQMSGSMKVRGCFKARQSVYRYATRFDSGSIAYRCDLAQRGFLEPIWIQTVSIRRGAYGQLVIMYIDNLNAIYAENELCSQGEAKLAAESYLALQISEIDQAIAALNC